MSASIGRTLLEYREFEGTIRSSLEATANTAADIEGKLRERLSSSEQHSDRLSALLEKATDLVPRLESAEAVFPAVLRPRESLRSEGISQRSASARRP